MAVIHAEIKFVRYALHRALFRAKTATGANILVYISCFFLDFNSEVAYEALDLFNLAV